jgi:hypothetical protein
VSNWILDFADEIMGRKLPHVLQQAGLKSKSEINPL